MSNIICVVGPTASGKTALAVDLARELDGEVLSCDSMQLYKYMDIGTAKPTAEEMAGIPHHMLDVLEPTQDCSVSKYCAMATPILEDILARGKTAIVCGGTGLYAQSLIQGNEFAPFPTTGCRQALEQRWKTEGIAPLARELEAVDPEALARSQGNPRRILRALEVYQETGTTITEHNRKTQAIPPRFTALWLGIDFENRQTLYNRIDRRVELMLQAGLVEEIRALLNRGIPEQATAMQAIGYKEFVDALAGRCTIEQAAAAVAQASRRYAKRQLTWFRRNEQLHWLHRRDDTTQEEILSQARQILRNFDN